MHLSGDGFLYSGTAFKTGRTVFDSRNNSQQFSKVFNSGNSSPEFSEVFDSRNSSPEFSEVFNSENSFQQCPARLSSRFSRNATK